MSLVTHVLYDVPFVLVMLGDKLKQQKLKNAGYAVLMTEAVWYFDQAMFRGEDVEAGICVIAMLVAGFVSMHGADNGWMKAEAERMKAQRKIRRNSAGNPKNP